MPDTSENLRGLLLADTTVGGNVLNIGTLIGQRIHVDHAPPLDELRDGNCNASDIKPFLLLARSSTDRDSCLGEVGTRPDVETFDAEFVAPDIKTPKDLAAYLHQYDSFRVPIDGHYVDIFTAEQSDDFVSKLGAFELGLYTTSVSIDIVHNR